MKLLLKSHGHAVDMTHGGLAFKIFIFAIPLIASGILQQSFNAVDVAVVGLFRGPQAMAAAGSNGMVISMMVNLFLGIAVGANVVISNYIGQNYRDGVRRAVETVGLLSIISGVILLTAGVFLARPILEAMSTPPDVIDLATTYLKIYFLGMPFLMLYNFGSAIMRSMGDTNRPFYSLMVASLVNIILDLVFVSGMGMGIEGVAIATVIANGVNGGIIFWMLTREKDPFTLSLREMKIYRRETMQMLRIGIPAGLQGMVFSFSNIFIQSSVNSFGSQAVAGSACCLTYECYCYYIVSAFGAATIAFVGQNYGAGLTRRCTRVFGICLLMSALLTGIANLTITLADKWFIMLFTDNPVVAGFAGIRIHTVLLFQFIAASYEIAAAYMRGLGYSTTPMILTIFGTCILRLVWVFTVVPRHHDFHILLEVYPITWVLTGVMVLTAAWIVRRRAYRKKNIF